MKTVFLIDDDADDREIFEMALSSCISGYVYAEAENGEDALNKLKSERFAQPSVIFLDLNMPKIDGRQFLKMIKQMDGYKDIPVFIYSTSSNEAEKKFAIDNGAVGFITKHNSLDELCAELMSALLY